MSLLTKFLEKRAANAQNPEAEMGFVDHLEVLRWHIFRSIIAIAVGAIFAFINIEFIFDKIILGPANKDFISYGWLCQLGQLLSIDQLCNNGTTVEFQNTEMTGQFMISFSSAATIGFILAFPYIFWEFWRFVKPALKAQELKYARGIVFWASLLFMIGVAFAYFVVAPFTINFFANYQLSPQFKNIITIANYYSLVSDLILGMGIIFEIPILVYFFSKVGLLTPRFLRENRRYAIVIILFLSAIITPPDWFTIFLVFLPLYALYEISILISAKINQKRMAAEALQEAEKPLDW